MVKKIGRRILAALFILLSLAAAWPALAESLPAEELVILLNGQPVEETVMNISEGSRLQFTSNRPVQWKSSKPYRIDPPNGWIDPCRHKKRSRRQDGGEQQTDTVLFLSACHKDLTAKFCNPVRSFYKSSPLLQ